MICITGDVHHSSLKTIDADFCKGSEIDAALRMAEIASDYRLSATLFFTGLCAKESPEILKAISDIEGMEVAGHNYYAFKPRKLFNLYGRLTGRRNGPRFFQSWEIARTIKALEQATGRKIVGWRNHGYRRDLNTRSLLKKHGLRYCSDELSADHGQARNDGELLEVPINTIPDHDYVFHGARQPGTFDEGVLMDTVFSTKAMTKETWLEKLEKDVTEAEERNVTSVLLIHPACMEVFDDFTTFEKLCRFLSDFETVKMREIVGVEK